MFRSRAEAAEGKLVILVRACTGFYFVAAEALNRLALWSIWYKRDPQQKAARKNGATIKLGETNEDFRAALHSVFSTVGDPMDEAFPQMGRMVCEHENEQP